uniref:Uncharacterized protein n=1 Tax=Rhizophora mucronata TaxID=61149 RepID=A0A2P2NVN0_RHIMU
MLLGSIYVLNNLVWLARKFGNKKESKDGSTEHQRTVWRNFRPNSLTLISSAQNNIESSSYSYCTFVKQSYLN